MNQLRQTYLTLAIIILVLLFSPISVLGATEEKTTDYSASGLVKLSPLPDSELSTEPSVVINGTSSEFSYTHSSSDGGYIDLVWSHTAGTDFDFKTNEHDDYPDCNDFIYFTQSFTWPYEGLDFPIYGHPQSVVVSLDCEESVTGDFSSREDHYLFFRVLIWLIDSSGDWINVFEKPSYWDDHSEKQLGTQHINRAWSGMIEDENGTQVDPTDTLTLAVGLAPTFAFEEWSSWNPWQNMTGTVTAHVTAVGLSVLGYFDVEIPGFVEPEHTGVFNDGFACFSEGIAEGPGDTIYTIGRSSSYEDMRSALILQKWDSEASLIWSREWNDTSKGAAGYDVDIADDGSIFVTGVAWQHVSDLNSHLLMKWSANGELLWNRTFDIEHKGYGRKVAVAMDGTVYTLGERVWFDSNEDPRYTPVLVKWDSNGNVLWSKNCSTSGFDYATDLEVAHDGTVYSTTWESILGFSSTGSVVLNLTEYAVPMNQGVALGPNGELYTLGRGVHNISLFLHGPDGERVKATNISRTKYEEFRTINLDLEPDTLEVLDNGSIFVLCGVGETGGYWTDAMLYKFNQNLELVWNRTLSMVTWKLKSWSSAAKQSLLIGRNGAFYVTATNASSVVWELGLLVFNLGDFNLEPAYPVLLLGIGAGTGLVLVMILYIVRRRRS
ncbi:MAG: hypothetical protein ACTSU3_07110 [Candidatus Thorarchaeota archaeon]